jgi:hypothetical protein
VASVAGTLQLVAQATISGVAVNPQGTSATVLLPQPAAGATGSGEQDVAFGTASGQGDLFCAGDFDLAPLGMGGTKTFDLFAGTDFKDLFGQTAAFRKLKAIFVGIVTGGDTAGVTIGNAGASPLGVWFGAVGSTWTIYPGGVPFVGGQPAGVTVDNTHKNVLLTNGSAVAVTVRVILVGSSV